MAGLTLRGDTPLPEDLPYWIKAFGLYAHFGAGDGAPQTVGYTLDQTGTVGSGQALRTLTEAEIANIEQSLTSLSASNGLTFVEVPADEADMRIGASSDPDEYAYGRAWQYTSEPVAVVAYDVVYGDDATGLARNSYIYLHEVLHGVGLLHSTHATQSSQDTVIPEDEETGTTLFGRWHSAWDGAPQIFDVAALQYLYGPSPDERTGDDIYIPSTAAFDPTSAQATSPLLWDGGGRDTIDLSNAAGPAIATLAPGAINQVNTDNTGILDAGTFSINYHSVFEALIGTAYDDRLSGWDNPDHLSGGAGKDTISGGKGDDEITGKTGRDNLKGGKGADDLRGGGGRDKIEGGKGRDVLTGGDGPDRFVFDPTAKTGTDRITDFEDGRDLIKFGAGLAFADVRITDTADGAQIKWATGKVILDGVTTDQLTEGDFLFG